MGEIKGGIGDFKNLFRNIDRGKKFLEKQRKSKKLKRLAKRANYTADRGGELLAIPSGNSFPKFKDLLKR